VYPFGPLVQLPLFSEGAAYIVLFREMISLNYRNLIKTVKAISEKTVILLSWGQCEGPLFLEPERLY
jgi:hypothetical protein